jgi:hypothetical protein
MAEFMNLPANAFLSKKPMFRPQSSFSLVSPLWLDRQRWSTLVL